MMPATFTAMINAAVAQNSNLASQIVPGLAGMTDPATESIAASEYLLQGHKRFRPLVFPTPLFCKFAGITTLVRAALRSPRRRPAKP